MKILATGDWHLTDKKPKRRTDDYLQSQMHKLQVILNLAEEEGVIPILQPGDFFDSYKTTDFLKQLLIPNLLKRGVVTIYGQHDLRFHSSNKENTPLAVMEKAEAVELANGNPLRIGHKVHLYGCSWGEEIPKIENPDAFNILLIHKMIIKNEKLWYGQEDYSTARNFLKRHLWDLVISGDNHQGFFQQVDDKTLINCGSLMRSTIAQKDHRPSCYIFDTETREMKEIFIPCKEFSEVFDETKIEEEKERNEVLEKFVDSLQNDMDFSGLNFSKNLQEFISSHAEIEEGTKNIITEIVGGFEEDGHIKRVRRSR